MRARGQLSLYLCDGQSLPFRRAGGPADVEEEEPVLRLRTLATTSANTPSPTPRLSAPPYTARSVAWRKTGTSCPSGIRNRTVRRGASTD